MIGNLWLSATIAVTVMFSTSIAYKSYNDIQESKDIQESFEIISEIKDEIAKQYNINPEDITRDEIIAYLPKGPNWEKVLLSSRTSGNNLTNSALIDEDGTFSLSEDEKIKLLALKAKLKKYGIEEDTSIASGKVKFQIGKGEKNFSYKDEILNTNINKTIDILDVNKGNFSTNKPLINTIIKNNTPYAEIYQNMKKSSTEVVSESEIKTRKEAYFKKRIKEKLLSSRNSRDMKLYNLIKDEL